MELEEDTPEVNINKSYSMVRYIHRRIANNKNFLVTITGPTGSGKSWTGLSIAELLDKDFTIDRVIFKARELMKLINSGKLKAGSVILWDEAGIDLSNRNWQSVTNKLLNSLLQTFRSRNFILIFTVPYHDFIDSASKKLFHADFETQKINKQLKEVIIKPKLLQYNSNLKKWYRKYLKVSINGRLVKIKRWGVPKPSEELIKLYESKKTLFTTELNDDIGRQMNKLDGGEGSIVVKKEGKDLICPHCKYGWVFTGKLMNTSCPSCRKHLHIEKALLDKGVAQHTYKLNLSSSKEPTEKINNNAVAVDITR